VLLPNHPNVVPAAEQAAAAAGKNVVVVPTGSIPAGLAAAAAHNPMVSAEDAAAAMDAAARLGRSGEVARAERNADTEAGPVRRGEWLGLSEGRVLATGDTAAGAAEALARALADGAVEIVTLVVGADAGEDAVAEAREAVAAALPGANVEVVAGGQPRFAFLIGVE
jgi:dihydroxyacetone kinase-like predicted kinase